MNNDRELLQQALDALEFIRAEGMTRVVGDTARQALRARLSQCDRCGEVNPAEIHTCTPKPDAVINGIPAYEGPLSKLQRLAQPDQPDYSKAGFGKPQREWVGLTDMEISEVLGGDICDENSGLLTFCRAIEAALKAKNA